MKIHVFKHSRMALLMIVMVFSVAASAADSGDPAAVSGLYPAGSERTARTVATVGEREVIDFIDTAHLHSRGVMIDLRTASAYNEETIPGSVNIPFEVFEKPAGDAELVSALESLGVVERQDVNPVIRALENMGLFNGDAKTDHWDFTNAKPLLLWCDGPRCEQSPRAINALLALGYPAGKLYHYRGGMQMWLSLGLGTVVPSDAATYASK